MSKKVLVVLDPGHYPKYNKGAIPSYYEGDKMYTLSEYEKEALESYGIKVIITRKREKDMDLYVRGQIAVKNAKGYDEVVFISNHSNAFNGKVTGVEIYRSAYLPNSTELAERLIDAIVETMRPTTRMTYSRGVKSKKGFNGDYYGVIRGSVSGAKTIEEAAKRPVKYSYIIEHGFHDNMSECQFLNDNSNLKKLAEAKVKVIADYFGLTKIKTPFLAKVTIKDLNIRKGAGTNYSKVKVIDPGTYTITEVKSGKGSAKGWGKLKSGIGWVSLDYVDKA